MAISGILIGYIILTKLWYGNLICGTTWMDLGSIVLGEISQAWNSEFAVGLLRRES